MVFTNVSTNEEHYNRKKIWLSFCTVFNEANNRKISMTKPIKWANSNILCCIFVFYSIILHNETERTISSPKNVKIVPLPHVGVVEVYSHLPKFFGSIKAIDWWLHRRAALGSAIMLFVYWQYTLCTIHVMYSCLFSFYSIINVRYARSTSEHFSIVEYF